MLNKDSALNRNGTGPVVERSLACYFKARLAYGAQRRQPPLQEDTCWYLGSLLERFVRSDRLFSYQDGTFKLRPLALLYRDALEAGNERERCLLLQQLGDLALFLGALFPDRYLRRGIGQDYFVGMGGGAYDYLAGNARDNRHVFAELANTFSGLLDLLAEACIGVESRSETDVLALYERWLKTRDPRLERQLQRLGITPSEHTDLH
ncbi:MAG: hypothetical protein AAGG11_21050 [Pseudomonadota bacterium]